MEIRNIKLQFHILEDLAMIETSPVEIIYSANSQEETFQINDVRVIFNADLKAARQYIRTENSWHETAYVTDEFNCPNGYGVDNFRTFMKYAKEAKIEQVG